MLPHQGTHVAGRGDLRRRIRRQIASTVSSLVGRFFAETRAHSRLGAAADDLVFQTKEGQRELARDFATPYAVVNASEDFADTFMLYLRKHEFPDAYASRPGVHRKVLAIAAAVKEQNRRLATDG
ncbi:MAG: hypothetical protein ACKOOF_10405 [Planctomycetaceae bacterium]